MAPCVNIEIGPSGRLWPATGPSRASPGAIISGAVQPDPTRAVHRARIVNWHLMLGLRKSELRFTT